MSYTRSTYRSSRYSEGLSDDSSFTRTSGRASSNLDSEFSSSSLSASRRAARTSSYGADDTSFPSSTVRRSSRLSSSTFDDDDFGTSTSLRSSSGRTARLRSRDEDELGITSSISRRYSGAGSHESTRKSSISSLTESTLDATSSRAHRRLKDDDAQEFTSKRSKLSSRTSLSEMSGSHAAMSYTSRRTSGATESSELGTSSYLKAAKSSYTYSDSAESEARPEVSAVGEVYEAIMSYKPLPGDEEGVALKEGQEVEVLDMSMPRKWRIRTKSVHTGVYMEGCVPSCYLEKKEGAIVEQPLSPKDKESLTKREAVVKELVETEEDFSRDMQYVVNTYLKETENPSMPKEIKEQKDILFSNFKDISDFHNTELIKGVQYNASEPAKLGVTFLRLERDFDKHVKYCAEAPRAQELLTSGPLKEYFDDFSKRVNDDKSLSDHLKLPIQRINDYQLLLKELIKYTTRLKEDASDLQRALDFMQAIPQRALDLQQTLPKEPATPKWSRVLKETGDVEITEHKQSVTEEAKLSRAISSTVEEMKEETSFTKEIHEDISESKSVAESKSSATQQSTEVTAQAEITEGFEAYQEATTATSALAESLRTASMTSLDASSKDSSEKPKFLKSVRGLTCAEGDNVTLECEIASAEPAQVAWLRNNGPLKDSPHVQQKAEGAKHSLAINNITVEDSGMYTIVASNPKGTASCSAPVYVKTGLTVSKGDSRPTSPGGTVLPHTPVFKVKLKDTELLQGTSVRFELVVRGCPEPEVTMYKNGKKLKEDDRVKVVFENKEVFELVIDHICFEDAGEYSCVAVNSEGKDETTGRITVTKDKILFQGLGDDELEELSAMSPPPKSPAFRWFKDGQEFEASERFQVTFDDAEDTLALVFQHVTPEDAGLYTCVASTSSGKISCSAELTVQGAVIKKAPEAPTASLSDVEANEGASVMLELKVMGYPKPDVVWKHNGNVIEAGGRYRFLFEDEETMTLVIKNVEKSDAGTYSVRAKNEVGSADTSCKLVVQSHPVFKKELKDVSVMTDQPLKLDVEVQGSPPPDVKWYKDGQALTDNGRVKILHPTEDKHSLVIDRAQPEDSGNYSCVIKNSTGTQTGFSAVSVNAAPKILKKLENYEAMETETVTFTTKFSGNPKPDVCWLKDKKKITADGKKHKTREEEGNVCTLVIENAEKDDVAEYTVRIANDYGTVEDSASLTIVKKPKFTEKLPDKECEDGDVNIKLTVTVEGSPAPKVKWLFNDVEICENADYSFESVTESGEHTLVIKKAKPELAGKITCEAENVSGKDACSGQVTVKSKPKIIKGLEDVDVEVGQDATFSVKLADDKDVSVTWAKDGGSLTIDGGHLYAKSEADATFTLTIKDVKPEDAGRYRCVVRNKYGEDSSTGSLGTRSKPEILEGMKDIEGEVGDAVSFTVKIAGSPAPDVVWNRNGEEVTADATIKIKADGPKHTLAFDDLTIALAGEYECVATNIYGEASTSGKLTVKYKPKFEKRPESVEVYTGEECTFEAKVVGVPTPDVQWLKDGEPIAYDDCVQATLHKDVYRLVVKGCKLSDACTYTCLAKNDVGTATSPASLTVKCAEDSEAPTFIRRMADTIAVIGDKARLEVRVAGKPKPTVTWYKDEEEIIETRHITIKQDEDTHSITLDNVVMEDDAKYSCKAVNENGEAVDRAKLTVKEPVAPSIDGLADQLVSIGGVAKFEATVTGLPTPEVVWLKNGTKVKGSENVVLSSDVESGSYTLVIRRTEEEDFGTYSCRATNSAGKAESDAELGMKGEAPTFVKELADAKVNKGDDATFEARIKGYPKPEATWLVNGRDISDWMNAEISCKGELYTLKISGVDASTVGEVTCKAQNSAGKASSRAALSLKETAPVIQQDLPSHMDVKEGEPLQLEAKVDGEPLPDVKWLKDGKPVVPDKRTQIEQSPDGSVALKVQNAKPEDAGKYSLVASNDQGDAGSGSDVTVVPEERLEPRAAPVKPVFAEGIKPTKITEGEPLELQVKATGSEPLEIQWLKDGAPVTPDDHVKVQTGPDGTSVLRADNAVPSDAGKYSAVAKNDAGDASTEGEVTIVRPPAAVPATAKEKPGFVTGLKDTKVEEGQPLRLSAKVQSDTPFTPKWLKDGTPITPDGRIKCEQAPDGTVALVIEDAKPEDAGCYNLVVENEGGEAATGGEVAVIPEEKPKSRPGLVKPKFIQGISPTMFTEGKPAKLQVECIGSQPLKIQWLKDGVPLKPSEHYVIESGPDGTSTLSIDKTAPSDAGKYAAVATNDAGEATTEGKVIVTPSLELSGMKPEFTLEVKGANLLEGQPLNLVGKVKSDTPFTVKWIKDGEEVNPSDRISITQEPDGTVVLSIEHANPDDSGKYVCVASNPEGRTRSAGVVDVTGLPKSKPEILDELKPAVFKEGEPGKLEAKVTGEPLPDIKWMKDGHELPDDSRIRSTTSPGGDVALSIDPVKPDDAGKYSLVAANDEGECRTSAPVTVNQPPIFTKPLEPVEVVEGYPARLDTKLTGEPTPDIKWSKDGKPLVPDGDKIVEARTPEGDASLVIPKAEPTDSGTYACKAKNPHGEAETKCPLKVAGADLTGQPEARPKVSAIDDVSVLEGEPITFEAKVTGIPLPEVKWFLDDQPVLPSDNIHVTFDGRRARLSIKKSHPSHAGVFECTATNPVGKASACGTASVTGMTKPRFTKRLSDMEAPHGQPLQLVCKVTGHPPPEITWYHNDNPIEPGLRYNMTRDGDTCGLTIPWPRDKDSGVYKCRAKNPLGEDWCEAKVSVRDKAERGEPPSFVKRLNDMETPEGATAKLTAYIAGTPFPEVKWFKDGDELKLTNRHRVESEPNGLLRLTIRDVRPDDAGDYRASIYNPHGSDSSTGTLRLETPVDRRTHRPLADRYPSYEKPSPEPSSPLSSEPPQMNGYEPYPGGRYTHEPPSSPRDRGDLPLPSAVKPVEKLHEPGDVSEPSLYKPVEKPRERGDVSEPPSYQPADKPRDRGGLPYVPYGRGTEHDYTLEPPFGTPYEGPDERDRLETSPRMPYQAPGERDGAPEIAFRAPYDRPDERGKQEPPSLAPFQKPDKGRDVPEAVPRSEYVRPEAGGDIFGPPPRTPYEAPDKYGRGDGYESPSRILYGEPRRPDDILERKPYERPEERGVRYEPTSRVPYEKAREPGDFPERRPYERPEERGGGYKPPLHVPDEKRRGPGDIPEHRAYERPEERGVGYEPPSRVPYEKPRGPADVPERPLYERPEDRVDGYEPPSRVLHEKARVPRDVPERRPYERPSERADIPKHPSWTPGERPEREVPYERPRDVPHYRGDDGYDRRTEKRPDYPRDSKSPRGPSPYRLYEKPHDHEDLYKPYERPHDYGGLYQPSDRPYVHDRPVPYKAGDTPSDRGMYSPPPTFKPFDRPDVSTPYLGHHPPSDVFEPRTYERPHRMGEFEPYYTGIPHPLSDMPHIRHMSDHHVTVGWMPSIPRGPRVPVTYTVEMASHPDGEWTPYQSGVRDTQLDIRGLEPFKDYRFRVRVSNKHGVSGPSPHVVAHRSQLRGEPPVPKDFKPKDYEIEHPPLDKHGSPPRFLRREEDITYGIRGHPVSIEFWVYGYPQPDITWHFKSTKLERGGRYDYLQDRNGQVTLFITRMTEENVGSYTCTAVNEHGEAMKTIYVDLAEEPVFIKRLEPTTIMLRRGGQLQCRAIGKPYPKIKWFKDWHPIADCSRVNVIWEEPNVCTLTLNESISRDAGLYSCSATNIAGTASCSANVTIEESESEFDVKTYRQPRAIKPRSKLFEDYYDIGDEVGRGTQGITYHAVERDTGKSYAVKAMHGTGRFKDWMQTELDMMGQLCHPKLQRLWDAFETKNSMSLITDLCGGGELLDNIISRDKLSEHEVANYIRQVLEGLNYMHSQNIAHLGLTLGDVLVTHINSDNIKIGDFALATRLHRNKDFIQEYGHPEFVAPEIALKRPATLASDMWSVGVMTYILLSGISPFLGQNDRETLKNVQNGKINFLDDGFAEVSDDARDFIAKLLVFEPNERLNVRSALEHPWLKITEIPDKGNSLSNIDRLKDYHKKWKSWYANASCRRCYRRRPLESCFSHPSRMIYPPDEEYTPPQSPARDVGRTKVKPSQFDETYAERISREPIDVRSESNYQCGPDTYLLQLRDVDFPLRLREYLRVGAQRSPSLAANLRDKHWGGFQGFEHTDRHTYPQVVVRERRKFVDVMDEEIDDEKKGLSTRTLPLRLQREVGSLGYTHQQLENLKEEAMRGKRPRNESRGKAPFFREKIQDCVIKENDEAVFTCYAVGDPEPQYSWFRNDGHLIESSRIQVKKGSNGRVELHLNPGKAYDAGVFKCVARNSHGGTVCHARLRIIGRPSRPEPPVCEQCSSSQIYVHWCNPKYEGNSRTVCFCLEMRESGACEWTKVSDSIMQEFWVVHELKPSTPYEFRVSAKNHFGWSESSIPSDACTTEPEGSSQKIKISRAHKYQQEMAERGQAVCEGMESALDYSRESNPVQLATGSVQDLYNFVSEIYVGRFSGVIDGWLKEQKCSAALKAIVTSPDIEESAKREYEILKSLCHERIVSLTTASFHDGLVMLGFERLSGMDVLTYLTLRHQYNEDTVARIIKQVFDAVEYLHFRGICYVELQPDNVVMTDEHTCNIKLVDFGSAQFISRTVCQRPTAASLEYLAPEVLKDQELSPATDVWGVGVLMYILLSGHSPFAGMDDEDTRNNILYVRYHFDKLYKEASTEATRFLMQLFKRRPEKRPTVAECLENKWLLPSEFMLRRRENSVFTSHRLQDFAAEFHAMKTSTETREKVVKMLGTSFSRSVSMDTDVMEE